MAKLSRPPEMTATASPFLHIKDAEDRSTINSRPSSEQTALPNDDDARSTPTLLNATSLSNSSVLDANEREKGREDSVLVVDWDGPDDPCNPRNWTNSRRWTVTLVVSLFTFMSPVASSIPSPSLPDISDTLGISTGSILQNMSLSIFVLAYALGPLLAGPLSELNGRLIVLQASNMWFLLFNTLCAFAKTPAQMLAFRFLAGLGGAAPQSVGGGVVGDLWSPEERGMAMSVYSLAPLIGPATGPLVGGWIAQKSNWRWVFWSVSIADALLQIAGFIFLRETYAPQILKRKSQKIRKSDPGQKTRTVFEKKGSHWTVVLARGLFKPMIFLATEPIVQVVALYMGVLYGILYLSLTTFVEVFTKQYGESSGIAGLHYLSIFIGSTIGGQLGARALNIMYRRLRAKNNGVGTPEMRLPVLMVCVMTLPVGLLIYGWTAKAHAPWIVPDLGVFIYFIGIGGNWTCIQTYLVDCYSLHAASAIAGVVSFRSLAGFGFPLFADKMYDAVGYGWGNTILALTCLVVGCPAPFVFYKYGPRLRAWGKGTSVEQ